MHHNKPHVCLYTEKEVRSIISLVERKIKRQGNMFIVAVPVEKTENDRGEKTYSVVFNRKLTFVSEVLDVIKCLIGGRENDIFCIAIDTLFSADAFLHKVIKSAISHSASFVKCSAALSRDGVLKFTNPVVEIMELYSVPQHKREGEKS